VLAAACIIDLTIGGALPQRVRTMIARLHCWEMLDKPILRTYGPVEESPPIPTIKETEKRVGSWELSHFTGLTRLNGYGTR
jgi:hypothetical protein